MSDPRIQRQHGTDAIRAPAVDEYAPFGSRIRELAREASDRFRSQILSARNGDRHVAQVETFGFARLVEIVLLGRSAKIDDRPYALSRESSQILERGLPGRVKINRGS